MEMGRSKSTFPDLPPRMTARRMKSGKLLYYYTGNRRKEPLGGDLREALHKYADMDTSLPVKGADTFLGVSDAWETAALNIGKGGKPRARKTVQSYTFSLVHLRKYFGANRLDSIDPMHVRQYLDRRTKKVAANREVKLLSVIWNWARSTGRTNKGNPVIGIEKNHEQPRERYVHNHEFQAVYDRAPFWLQDAMELLLLTYQRPADVLKARTTDISDGYLWFRQGKTGKRLGFAVEGELATVIQRCQSRPRNVAGCLHLVADKNGQPVAIRTLQAHFQRARGDADWQLRDLRAKAVTDTEDIRDASERAGHSDLKLTRRVYDRTRGRKVRSLR